MQTCFCIGSKAEFIKTFPVMLELQRRNIPYKFIATGQHNLDDLIETFGTKTPDIIINARDGFKGNTGGAMGWAIKTLPKLIKYLSAQKDIDFVIVHGDTMSTLIGAVAGRLTRKKVCHIEAGLRSGNLKEPFPEEIVRKIVDKISKIKFAPSEKSKNRLKGLAFNTGNTSVDSLHIAIGLLNKPYKTFKKGYAVATIHRHENIKSKERMEKIIKTFSYCEMPLYWFLHENARHKLEEYGLLKDLKYYKNLFLINPLEYSQFVYVMKDANLVFTDGGGMSEECAELNVPCIILRNETEREELLDRPDQVLTKLDVNIAKEAILKFSLPRTPYKLFNPYNNGNSSKNIIDILLNLSGQ